MNGDMTRAMKAATDLSNKTFTDTVEPAEPTLEQMQEAGIYTVITAADALPITNSAMIVFENTETGQQVPVKVLDKAPAMGDVHVEGRKVVELSIEMFVDLMDRVGWFPVTREETAPEHRNVLVAP